MYCLLRPAEQLLCHFFSRSRKWSSCDAKTGPCRSTLTASQKKLISFKPEVRFPLRYIILIFSPKPAHSFCTCLWLNKVNSKSLFDPGHAAAHTHLRCCNCAVNDQFFLNCILSLVGNKGFIGPLAALHRWQKPSRRPAASHKWRGAKNEWPTTDLLVPGI